MVHKKMVHNDVDVAVHVLGAINPEQLAEPDPERHLGRRVGRLRRGHKPPNSVKHVQDRRVGRPLLTQDGEAERA